MVFVDTSAWFAIFDRADFNHGAASAWYRGTRQTLVTTDFVVDETLTLLRVRGKPRAALKFGDFAFEERNVPVRHLTEAEIRAAWDVFRTYSDKDWSFTDCTSLVVMRNLGLTRAFTFDHHFRQFGKVQVVP